MPKRNRLPERPDFIEITEQSQNRFVQKQKSLMMLQDSDIPLTSLKLIDLYLSKLDNYLEKALTPEERAEKVKSQRIIHIKGGELERTLEVTKINSTALYDRLKPLLTPILMTPKDDNHLLAAPLFKRLKADKEQGFWNLELEMSEDAEAHIFIPEHIHYLRYRLKNITGLSSRYAYFLYMYLEDERFKHTDWRVPLEELKELLGCKDQASYQKFKLFNHHVLLKAQKELEERTDCRFTYETITSGKGGKVVAIVFHLEEKAESNYQKDFEQLTFDDILEPDKPIEITAPQFREDEQKILDYLHGILTDLNSYPFNQLTDRSLLKCCGYIKKTHDERYPTLAERQRDFRFFNFYGMFDYKTMYADVLQEVMQKVGDYTQDNFIPYFIKSVQNYCDDEL